MKKYLFFLIGAAVIFFSTTGCSTLNKAVGGKPSAQTDTLTTKKTGSTLGDIINGVFGATPITQKDLVGAWAYKRTACAFESENLLKKAGGLIVASQVENKFDDVCKKAGIKEGNTYFTFKDDSTYSAKMGIGKISGKFRYDRKTEKVTMTYLFGVGKITGMVHKSGNSLKLMFDADSMLKLMKVMSEFTDDTSVEVLGKMADMYDGMLLGFDLRKK